MEPDLVRRKTTSYHVEESVFWAITASNLLKDGQRFEGWCHWHLHGKRLSQAGSHHEAGDKQRLHAFISQKREILESSAFRTSARMQLSKPPHQNHQLAVWRIAVLSWILGNPLEPETGSRRYVILPRLGATQADRGTETPMEKENLKEKKEEEHEEDGKHEDRNKKENKLKEEEEKQRNCHTNIHTLSPYVYACLRN